MRGLLVNLSGLQHSVVLVHVVTPNARLGGSSAASVSYSGRGPAQAGSLETSDLCPACRCSHSNSTGDLTGRYATNELQPKHFAHLAHDGRNGGRNCLGIPALGA